MDVIYLEFDDLDRMPEEGSGTWGMLGGDIRLFTKDMADKIVEFLERNDPVLAAIIHCEAGISRSAGVAAAMARIYNGTDQEFFNPAPRLYEVTGRYRPNLLVYRLMMESLYESKNGKRLTGLYEVDTEEEEVQEVQSNDDVLG
jgi:predicted protein tyrosine phosphatase